MQKAQSAIGYIDNSDRSTRLTVAAALRHEYGNDAASMYFAWAGDDAGERAKRKWAIKARKVTMGSVYHLARQGGWKWEDDKPDPDAARRAIERKLEIEAEEQQIKQAQKAARSTAAGLWAQSEVPWPHPYLDEKKFSGELAEHCHARRHGKFLLIPAYDMEDALRFRGEVLDVQRIADGQKKFTYGGTGATGKAMMIFGGPRLSIVEGWATGVARFAGTGDTVLVSFTADNSVEAAYAARRVYPNRHITYVMDNDKSGTGQARAERASQVVNDIYKPRKVGHDYWDEWSSGV